ncbi:MAG: enoyl-CoA hydratase/isomerase family protein [Flavobacteriales bacterium]|nr:enoyl-CoA hydratase/isomerase family protein [Flavobacteriales bacterium]
MSLANRNCLEIEVPALLNPASIDFLNQKLVEAEEKQLRFILLKGSSEAVFCNGLDLRWVTENENGNYMPHMQAYGAFLKKLQTGKFISIAYVRGSAAGGGMGIVCACDHVIADSKSEFSLPEGLLGLIPGMILPALLHRLTPLQVKKMVLMGGKFSMDTVKNWQLIEDFVSTAEEAQLALSNVFDTYRSCKIDSVGAIKELVYNSNMDKDLLAQNGMDILIAKLNEPEISDRLKAIAEFMED